MRRLLLASLAFTVAACGSNNGTNASPDMSPTYSPMSKSYSLTPFTLQPGEEKIMCYYVPPAADATDTYFNKITVDMAAGSHHLIVMRLRDSLTNPAPAYGPTDCINGEIPIDKVVGMLPGSQQQHMEYQFPDGVGMKINASEGLWFQSHYINATTAEITTAVTWNISTIDPSAVTNLAGEIFYSDQGLSVPPGMSVTKMSCAAPYDMNLLTATGHMHRRGIDFKVDVNGMDPPLFHTTDWSEPNGNTFPSPGIAVKAGDMFNFACTYNNTTTNTYVFGNSAINNEMCIFPALFYPAPDGQTLFLCTK